jgi:hypothetical protein
MTVKRHRKAAKHAGRARPHGHAKRPPTSRVSWTLEDDGETMPEPEPPVTAGRARLIERLEEDEDDFADGRSSGGLRMRAEEDSWGRGLAPEERPFEEEDVPPRGKRRAPRSEPTPEAEEEPPPEV